MHQKGKVCGRKHGVINLFLYGIILAFLPRKKKNCRKTHSYFLRSDGGLFFHIGQNMKRDPTPLCHIQSAASHAYLLPRGRAGYVTAQIRECEDRNPRCILNSWILFPLCLGDTWEGNASHVTRGEGFANELQTDEKKINKALDRNFH